jgi:hypothetical protein
MEGQNLEIWRHRRRAMVKHWERGYVGWGKRQQGADAPGKTLDDTFRYESTEIRTGQIARIHRNPKRAIDLTSKSVATTAAGLCSDN